MRPRLVMLDLDGTIVETISGKDFKQTADDWEFIPGVVQKVAMLQARGVIVGIATNQGGVAYGFHAARDILRELRKIAAQLNLTRGWRHTMNPEGFYVCFCHPSGIVPGFIHDHPWRKPAPGMILAAMKDTHTMPEETRFIGDRPEDQEAARRAGVSFGWAQEEESWQL